MAFLIDKVYPQEHVTKFSPEQKKNLMDDLKLVSPIPQPMLDDNYDHIPISDEERKAMLVDGFQYLQTRKCLHTNKKLKPSQKLDM